MKTSLSMKALSLFLVPLMIGTSGGCAGFETVTKLDDYNNKTLRLATRDGERYELSQWKLLNDRGIVKGSGARMTRQSIYHPLRRVPFQGEIALQEIIRQEIQISSFRVPDELILGVGIIFALAIAMFVAGVIALSNLKLNISW